MDKFGFEKIKHVGEKEESRKRKSMTSPLHVALSKHRHDQDTTEQVQLKRHLEVHHGVAILIGLIVGSGIWVAPRGVLAGCGSPGMAMLVWLAAGLFGTLGALCYAELGTTFPQSGEKYIYLSKMMGPFPAFMYMWSYLLAVRPGSNAIKLITFSNYVLQAVAPGLNCQNSQTRDTVVLLISVSIALLLTFINCMKVKWTAMGQNMCMFLTVMVLLVISIYGLVWLGSGYTQNIELGFKETTTDATSIILSVYSAIYAFGGWFALNFIVEELKDPNKNMPRAIYVAMAMVTSLYLLVNMAYITVLDKEVIITSGAVAMSFAEKVIGKAAFIMPVCIAINTIGSFNAGTITGSRLYYVGSREGHLPDFLSLINVNYLSPVTSLAFQCFVVIVYCCIGDIYYLIRNMVFIVSCFDMMTILGLLYLRKTQPKIPRPLKIPLVVPILFAFSTFFLVCIPLFTRPTETVVVALLALCTGIPYYVTFVLWKSRPKLLNMWSRQVTILAQKLFYCVKQEGEIQMQ